MAYNHIVWTVIPYIYISYAISTAFIICNYWCKVEYVISNMYYK